MRTQYSRAFLLPAALLLASLAACSGGGGGGSSSAAPSPTPPVVDAGLSQAARLGELIFKDQSLSASGKQSCATCHSPDCAHGPTNNLSAQLGGANGDVQGFRAAPSLRYLNQNPAFFFAKDGTPTGGIDRDGRAQSLAEQAERPFLAPHEMANASKQDVIDKLKKAPYVEQFRAQFGAAILDNAEQAFSRMTFALQTYQLEDTEFHPFDSKYDQFLAGKVKLSDQELRGLALFNDPTKGNCIGCHTSARGANGAPPLFTDFTFDNLGVPRNKKLAATADPAYFDLGLCGPDRTDLTARTDLCGAFKVPTLRNVATRQTFFHNGAFDNLKDVVAFYVRRDTNPEEWYPTGADGVVQKFNDLPPQYRKNVNTTEVPYNRQPGMAPALSPSEIDDVVTFLGTLTDGYKSNP
ncbi:cytochrome-c peroxidase [Duganella sp. BJB488]|uniref:cytochrome-c peroxidase n=1 Tax=unclassified Duganella TaxID=2636909 RepID=UPI000E350F6D|nr:MULTISPECIES: cytochrome c peroxidase [unclassified Duganella]RFP21899.1 cytochrome-c peroxidase [Duganella sp. BJB489]RFP23690.1 cytochrome-c peroxidase [Duganella sp. BJB488]RFP38858.1 cytochrome-c peroxidase [Duganella sp. BJB480]